MDRCRKGKNCSTGVNDLKTKINTRLLKDFKQEAEKKFVLNQLKLNFILSNLFYIIIIRFKCHQNVGGRNGAETEGGAQEEVEKIGSGWRRNQSQSDVQHL
jgi:hypothetical protein